MFIKSSLIYLDTMAFDNTTLTKKVIDGKPISFINGEKVIDSFYCNYGKKRRKAYGMALCLVTESKIYNFVSIDKVYRYIVK